jgi:hypothetical protein
MKLRTTFIRSSSESDAHRKVTGSLMAAYEVLGSG